MSNCCIAPQAAPLPLFQPACRTKRTPAASEDHSMARELWKGAIQFGLVNIPVSLYPAEHRNELSFTMLDRRDMQPVGYKRVNKSTGAEVPFEQIVKGYETGEGEYVTLEKDDFKRANV